MTERKRQARRKPAPAAATDHLLGSDVYEGDIMDWQKLKGQLFFLVMRAHYGDKVDTQFANYFPASKGIGLRSGAYGFLLPSQSVSVQVDTAVQAVNSMGGFKTGDMGFYADAENPRAWLKLPSHSTLSVRQRQKVRKEIVTAWLSAMPNATTRMDFLLAYMNGLKDKLGSAPGLYVSPGFLSQVFTDLTPLGDFGLWIAHWNTKAPSVPAPWNAKTPSYELWQDLGDAWACPGINGGKKNKADRDWFPGNEADFNARFGTPST